MATALSLIQRAMRTIGVLSASETLSSADANDALESMNAMIDGFRNESLLAWSIKEITAAITANDADITIGTGGNINTTRPVSIENARVRINNVDYPVSVIDQAQWASIRSKTVTTNLPQYIYDDGDFPLRTLTFWPIPTQNMSLILGLQEPIAGFATLATAVSLPAGYEDLIVYGLALRMAPEFGVTPSPVVVGSYANARKGIARINKSTARMKTGLSTGRAYNIYADV